MNSRKQWSEWRHKNEIKNLSLHYRLIYHRGPRHKSIYCDNLQSQYDGVIENFATYHNSIKDALK
mgnify:FL=1